MDSFTMPDSAFKADKRETEESISRLNKRVADLESDVKYIANILGKVIRSYPLKADECPK